MARRMPSQFCRSATSIASSSHLPMGRSSTGVDNSRNCHTVMVYGYQMHHSSTQAPSLLRLGRVGGRARHHCRPAAAMLARPSQKAVGISSLALSES